MQTGSVKTLVKDKGFGFVKGDDGRDVFFHKSACDPGVFDNLSPGTAVQFELDPAKNAKGPRAKRVVLA